MITQVLFLYCFLSFDGEKTPVPESLAKAINRRMSFSTAFFEYEYEAENPGKWRSPKHKYEARFAGEDVYWTEFGDDDGIVLRDPMSASPYFGIAHACVPARYVRCNNGRDQWSTHDGHSELLATLTRPRVAVGGRAPDMFLDPRSAGLHSRAKSETSPANWLEDLQASDYKWSEKLEDGKIEVAASTVNRADSNSPFAVFVWKIDPKKDDAILEFTGFVESPSGSRKQIEQLISKHERVDGRWWPMRCETRFSKGGGETFTFTRVEFDRKEHPSKLDPDFLGVPPGVAAIDRIHHDKNSGPLRLGHYIGDGIVVSVNEWHETYKNKIDPSAYKVYAAKARAIGGGEYPRWWNAGGETLGLEGVSRTPDLWEAYVRRWILRHSDQPVGPKAVKNPQVLSAAQIDAAWGILKDCRKRAQPAIQRMSEVQLTGANTPDRPDMSLTSRPANGHVAVGNSPVKGTEDRNQREIEKIFETLRTRLDGLLTAKQQHADAKSGDRK